MNRLISIDLQGYKTFASSTKFEFPGQITAIVGPNGSGKSNIADAVRWVLGEQAYSLLRGKRTEDMIFSGSDHRPRASMAVVSISLDNTSEWLPIDFSEVIITRRAYRSGENEYLINNQKVRLKEINELLGNSGLGERNYTIIGQGLLDNALSLRPEERRKFIEEAAGIDLYRSRREEAIQKLDRTIRNMERVNDILHEIKPRINFLLKSKEKASQYKQVQEELLRLLYRYYGFYWYRALDEVNETESLFRQHKTSYEEAKKKKDKKESKLNQTRENLNKNRADLASLHKKVSEFHLEIEAITRKSAVLEEREKTQKLRIAELENEIENIQITRDQLLEEIRRMQSSSDSFQSDLQSTISALKTAESKISQKIVEREKLEVKNKRISEVIFSNQSRILELDTRGKNLQNDIKQKQYEIKSISAFIKSTDLGLSEIDHSIRKLISEQDQNKKEIAGKTIQLEEIKIILDNVKLSIEKTTQIIQKEKTTLSEINAEYQVLRDAEEHLNGFTSGSVSILKARKEKKLQSNISSILDHLEIPEQYDTAIAAALGEVLEGIVLEENNEPIELLNFLETQNIPRTAIFTGIDGENQTPLLPMLSENLLTADSLLKGSSEITRKLRALLSRTLVVENRKQALKIFKQIIPGWKIVTMIGEVFDGNRVITAGTGSRVQPIRRKRQKIFLESDIHILKKEITAQEEELIRLKVEEENNQNRLNSLSNDIKNQNEFVQTIHLNIQKMELEKNQKIRQRESEKGRLEGLQEAIRKIKDEAHLFEGEIKDKKFEIQSLQKTIQEKPLVNINQEIELIRKAVLELTSRKAVTEELYTRQKSSIKSIENSIEISNNRIKEYSVRIGNLRKSLEESIIELKTLSGKYSDVTYKINEINEKIIPIELSVESIIGEQGKIIEDVDEERRLFAVAERQALQYQIKLEKLQDHLQILQQKMMDDYRLAGSISDLQISEDQNVYKKFVISNLTKMVQADDDLENKIEQKKSLLRKIGPFNPEAENEFDDVNSRFLFLTEQLQDLEKAEKDSREIVKELDELMGKKFKQTFSKVNEEFKDIFGQLFNGGSARLIISDENHALDEGIDIEATLPGKRKQGLALLSGGERSLTAVALIFALLRISPTPFCILDEVDAMLDETNVEKFGELLRELSDSTQFIVITHNRNTVQLADVLYGVTMGKDSVSQVISLRIDELTEEMMQ